MSIFDSVDRTPGPLEAPSTQRLGSRRRRGDALHKERFTGLDTHESSAGDHDFGTPGMNCPSLELDIFRHQSELGFLKDLRRECIVRNATLPPDDPRYCSDEMLRGIEDDIEQEEADQADARNVFNRECKKIV